MEDQFPRLNFPAPAFRIISGAGQSSKIFDMVRRKYVLLTPEEWVRQHLLHFLINEKKFPPSLIGVEKKVLVNGMPRRTDVLIFNQRMEKMLLAECKAPAVKISQAVFDQAARYNLTLDVKYFVLTNGIDTYCCTLNHELRKYEFLREVPEYDAAIHRRE